MVLQNVYQTIDSVEITKIVNLTLEKLTKITTSKNIRLTVQE